MNLSNAFSYTGFVSDDRLEPLANEKTGEVIGVSVTLEQRGQSCTFFINNKLIPVWQIRPDAEIRVVGKLVPRENGWAKPKVKEAELVSEAPDADGDGTFAHPSAGERSKARETDRVPTAEDVD